MTPAGFPHSDIHGSQIASISPWLFAGSRVLHRRLVPRHSPCALSTLTCSAHAGSVCASGAVIPMVCGLKPEVPFGNPELSYIHSARRLAFSAGSTSLGLVGLSESTPTSSASRPYTRYDGFLLLFVFEFFQLSENRSGTRPENRKRKKETKSPDPRARR